MSTFLTMTCNIHGLYRWQWRQALNVKIIQTYAPDLIGFQELEEGNLEAYREHITEYDYLLGFAMGDKEPYSYNAIFWKPARLCYLAHGSFRLSSLSNVPSDDLDTASMRTAHWIRFQELSTGQRFLHINTHLDHRSAEARIEGARRILSFQEQLQRDEQLPVMLTGDFNCNPDTAVYTFLQEQGFVDAYRSTGHQDREYVQCEEGDGAYSNTVHAYGWTKPSSSGAKVSGAMRFDWLLLQDRSTNLKPISCEIVRDALPPLYPSDHYPVLTEFEVKE